MHKLSDRKRMSSTSSGVRSEFFSLSLAEPGLHRVCRSARLLWEDEGRGEQNIPFRGEAGFAHHCRHRSGHCLCWHFLSSSQRHCWKRMLVVLPVFPPIWAVPSAGEVKRASGLLWHHAGQGRACLRTVKYSKDMSEENLLAALPSQCLETRMIFKNE